MTGITQLPATPYPVGAPAPYVTSLPASPYDGQEVYYKVEEGVVWHLRYNASSGNTYKWEYLGGPPKRVEANTSRSPTSTGDWYGLVTDGASPALTFPLAGIYDVQWGAEVYTPANTYIYMGVNMSGAGTWKSVLAGSSTTANRYSTPMRETRTTVNAAAGGTLACYYNANSTSTAVAYRHLSIRPVSVG